MFCDHTNGGTEMTIYSLNLIWSSAKQVPCTYEKQNAFALRNDYFYELDGLRLNGKRCEDIT